MAVQRDVADTSGGRVVHRAMQERDLAGVTAVEREAYLFPWTEGIFRDCLRAGYTCRVIEVADGIGGYGIFALGADEVHVLNLCIRADLRGRTLGRRLLVWLLDEVRALKYSFAFLEVRPSNRPAIQLYESLGFRQVGSRPAYYQAVGGREDAWVYRLDLHAGGAARDRAAGRVDEDLD